MRDVGAVQPYRALFDPSVAGQQAQNRLSRGRLARTGFAHQRHDLAAVDMERYAMNDSLAVVADLVGDREIVDLEKRGHHGAVFPIALLMRSAARTTSTTTSPGAAVSHHARER